MGYFNFRMVRLAPVALAFYLFAGCTTQPSGPVNAYIGAERPLTDLAVVLVSDQPAELTASIIEYGEGNSKFGMTKIPGGTSEIRLVSGKYTVGFKCSSGNSYAFPHLLMEVSAGSTYEIACRRTGAVERLVRVGIVSIHSTNSDSR